MTNATGAAGETAELVADLHAYLLPVRLAGMTAPTATQVLTRRVVRWAQSRGWTVDLAAPGRSTHPTSTGERQDRLDLVCARPLRPPIAIEIDRAGRLGSLRKLLAEAEAGSVALWVRWHGRTRAAIPSQVGLVDIGETAGWTPPGR
ncbi:hypothetical protein [Streptoalloteichus hindustanus]|uniref:Uncharacterized protein n=1 Tax=Streptoalloteichus hindustanus TaxID=2017 RepID=A0A1M5I377_STRHI|nr:hypothetical protein [Streptoalloteichus hindustanus]SHG22768.1 hypothetical protein SAMN05444320_10783 [Streptoalloteichus hindustanus]